MWLLEERDSLSMVGFTGFNASDLERWHRIPMSFDSQMVDVVRHGEIFVTSNRDFPGLYPNATFDHEHYRLMMDRLLIADGDLVGLPIIHLGRCLGVIQFTTDSPRDWTPHDFSVLSGVSAALGMWASHSDTPIAPLYVNSGDEPMLIFTKRQQDIIRLVLDGVGNHQIASDLLVSVSTVKQELQRIMRATSQNDRVAAARCAVEMGLIELPA